MEHPHKILSDAAAMYSARLSVAMEARQKCRNAGMSVVMGEADTRIVPDMRVLCLDRDQLAAKADTSHPTTPGALAMFDRTDETTYPFGVLFQDGSVLAMTIQLHDADRDR